MNLLFEAANQISVYSVHLIRHFLCRTVYKQLRKLLPFAIAYTDGIELISSHEEEMCF